MLKNLGQKSNTELELLRKEKMVEFYRVKQRIIDLYDYWGVVEQNYHDITNELKKRNPNIDG